MRPGAITAVLALLSVFPPVATDMYLSSMDDLGQALNDSSSATELSLSLFFLGLCVGQLIMGPLIDGYGRKGPLLAGVALFTATSLALLFIRDVTLFNTLRFFQAVGACAGMVVGRAGSSGTTVTACRAGCQRPGWTGGWRASPAASPRETESAG